jgi:hypothetical protein
MTFAGENNTKTNFDVILDKARLKRVQGAINEVIELHKYITQYILLTGDINPTIVKIKKYLELNHKIWAEEYIFHMSFTIERGVLICKDIIKKTDPSSVLIFYKNKPHPQLDEIFGIINKKTLDITIPLSSSVLAFSKIIQTVNDLNINSKIIQNFLSPQYNSDVNGTDYNGSIKTYYNYIKDGRIKIYNYIQEEKAWKYIGAIGDKLLLTRMGEKECLGTLSSKDDLKYVVALDQRCAMVYNDTSSSLDKYQYVASINKWVKSRQIRKNLDDEIKPVTLMELATTHINAKDGTKMRAQALKKWQKFRNYLTFTKDTKNKCWYSPNRKFIVSNVRDNINIDDLNKTDVYAYIPNLQHNEMFIIKYIESNKTAKYALEMETEHSDVNPYRYSNYKYLAKNYKDILEVFSKYDLDIDNTQKEYERAKNQAIYIYDVNTTTVFRHFGDKSTFRYNFISLDGKVELSNKYSETNGTSIDDPRNAFTVTADKNWTHFYTYSQTCKKRTCYQDQNGLYFPNHKDGELYEFIYAPNIQGDILQVNHLTNNLNVQKNRNMYNSNYRYLTYQGDMHTYERVDNASQTPDQSYSYGYKNIQDNKYYTNDGIVVPDEYISDGILQLPKYKTLKSKHLFKDNILLLENYSNVINYTNAPNNVKVKLKNGIYLKHIIDEYDNADYWASVSKDDTNNIDHNILLAKNRENFIDITNNYNLIITAQLGDTNSLNNKNETDISYYLDGNVKFYKWYYFDIDNLDGDRLSHNYTFIHNITDALDINNPIEGYRIANSNKVLLLKYNYNNYSYLLYKKNENYRWGKDERMNVWKKSRNEYLGKFYLKGFLPSIDVVENATTKYIFPDNDDYQHSYYYTKSSDNKKWCATKSDDKDWTNYYWDESSQRFVKPTTH